MKYRQAGWFIPGNLKAGWANYYQSNFNDLRVKTAQLGLQSLVPGLGPEADLGFYFSQGPYDFIQLLRTGGSADEPGESNQTARVMVAYSLWFSNQGWGSFSPVPLLEPSSSGGDDLHAVAPPLPGEYSYNPAGWYLIARFESAWYRGLEDNLRLARDKRKELGLRDLSAFYFTNTAEYQGLQLLQAAMKNENARGPGPEGTRDRIRVEAMPADGLMEYIAWFGEKGFGSLNPTPFMSTTLVSAALILAGRNP